MNKMKKDEQAILEKLGVKELNDMQIEAHEVISEHSEVILLSPTGTGKTIAFLLPIIANLDPNLKDVQVLILAPSRELALQIEQVSREMGSGYKINVVYGGRPIIKDKTELASPPAILIGTPGRVADHIRRGTFSTKHIKTLVLDEFDKSLEVGFEEDMSEIAESLRFVNKKILTSATQIEELPYFIRIRNPKTLNYLTTDSKQLQIKVVSTSSKDKLDGLIQLLKHLGNKNGIVFCNFRNSIQFVSDHLSDNNIDHACFHGDLDQIDRERALIKFRNGTHRLLLATDLAARGIDVPEMDFIIHYQLPPREEEFIHRNGRTARMHSTGTSYILNWEEADLYDFVQNYEMAELETSGPLPKKEWDTLFISGGRKDKISKGDIAGLFFKQGQLKKEELGLIELKHDCAFVSVPHSKSRKIAGQLNNSRLKKKKVRIQLID
jgi:superfamily II DNA/RNA helicase